MRREQRPTRTGAQRVSPGSRPPLRVFTTTLWEYPSQHYDAWIDAEGALHKSTRSGATQGSKDYTGATPSWVIWQCLMRYTRPGHTVLDPMCGGGTTLDVCADLDRRAVAFDLAPSRPDIKQADARRIPLPSSSTDFIFIDPPYSTHVDYSDDPRCIGKLSTGGEDQGAAYYDAMGEVIGECHRVLRNERFIALYVSDSFRKRPGKPTGEFMPIGFHLLNILGGFFTPVDIIAVTRHNQKLERGNWRKAAEEGNFFLRGFNYLFICRKDPPPRPSGAGESARRRR